MSRHSRIRDRGQAFLSHGIAVANPASLHPHPNLTSLRVGHFSRYEFNWPALADHLRIPSSQLCHRYFSFQLHECRIRTSLLQCATFETLGMVGGLDEPP